MTTCRDIVARALRMSGIIGKGRDVKAAELDDAMFALQSLYDGMFTGGMFGRLRDKYATSSLTAKSGQRIYITSGTVTLPPLIDNRWQPYDLSAIEVNDLNGKHRYIWDSTGWVDIANLTPDDDAPLAEHGAEGLAALLAIELVSDYGQEPSQTTSMKANRFKFNVRTKYGTQHPASHGIYF